MKKLLLVAVLLLASISHAADKKVGRQHQSATLEERFDSDAKLVLLQRSDNFTFYGIKGTAKAAGDGDVRSAQVVLLFTARGRGVLKGSLKGSFYSRENWSVNCKKRTLNIGKVIYYNASGKEVTHAGVYQWEPIVPESVADHFREVVCSPPGSALPGVF